MRPCLFTVTTIPPLGSSGFASAVGSFTSTPPCMIGAVIMKITMRSIITSMRLTTLISAFSGVRSPRRRCMLLDPPLANHQRDQLGAEAFELTVQPIHAVREDVVPEHRRNGHGQRGRGGDQRLSNTRRYRRDVP